MAASKISHAGLPNRNFHTNRANAASAILPIVAPRASKATAFLARLTPFMPARCFFSFSCFSIRVALAGKIAGNARNSPPTTGPYAFATMPVATVARPPKTIRRKTSYHFVCFNAESWNLTTIYLRKNSQIPKAVASHVDRRPAQTRTADGLYLNMTHVAKHAYTKNATAPPIMDRASSAA